MNVTWYYFDFWAWKKVNLAAIKSVVPLITLDLTELFSLILQLHGIIVLWKFNEKRIQHLAAAMNLRKRNLYLRKPRKIKKQPPDVFYKKAVLKSFAIFTGNHLCWIFCAGGRQACKFIKMRLQHRCFPVNIRKCLRTPILQNICERLLPQIPTLLTIDPWMQKNSPWHLLLS